jgi:hypothetical protein
MTNVKAQSSNEVQISKRAQIRNILTFIHKKTCWIPLSSAGRMKTGSPKAKCFRVLN